MENENNPKLNEKDSQLNNPENGNDNKETGEEQQSWFQRNMWLIAVCVAIFILRMCSEFSK